jgi:hypothetical protein
MSPRAAWRLERLGFKEVYDFVPGKMAWLAMGWPREGTAAKVPNAGEVARRGTPTCALDDKVGDVREKVLAVGRHVCIVVNDAGIVEGRLRGKALEETPEATAEEAMEIRRPSAPTSRSSPWWSGCAGGGSEPSLSPTSRASWSASCIARTRRGPWRPREEHPGADPPSRGERESGAGDPCPERAIDCSATTASSPAAGTNRIEQVGEQCR